MFINALDMARYGLLTARNGKWGSKQLLSTEFLRQARTPTSAPASAFVHVGNGTNIIYIDPDNDLLIVARWIENNKIDEFLVL